MARVQKTLTALNDAITLDIPNDDIAFFVGVYLNAGAVGTVVLEHMGYNNEWIGLDITTTLPAGIAHAGTLAGGASAVYGYAFVPGAKKVRCRKSVAGGGDAIATLILARQ